MVKHDHWDAGKCAQIQEYSEYSEDRYTADLRGQDMTETIAAIATGLTESGIGIIRISGPESYDVIRRVFRTGSGKVPDLEESHRVHHGYIDVSRGTLDEVLMINMKGPRSYTGEDTIEIDCHGGVLMMKRILEAVLEAGARLAEPGEFTKRAFLNGRIDLSQAEAVADIITAKNDRAINASVAQLRGSISERIRRLREIILEDTAYIEAALDDPEHIELEGFSEKLEADVGEARREIERLIRSSESGRLIKEGINTVILGKPNAGKSSLLNALLREDRAIVTDIAGTTRDTLTESINLNGLSLNIADTAGIRDTDDVVERIGVERALKAAESADLIIYVVDGSVPLDDPDRQIIDWINASDKKCLVIINKNDLEQNISESELRDAIRQDMDMLSISAMKSEGIEELEKKIEDMFSKGDISFNDEVFISSERQKQSLILSDRSLSNVEESIGAGLSEDFYTIDLMDAYTELGHILGESVDEDLVDEIFGKFCMGK